VRFLTGKGNSALEEANCLARGDDICIFPEGVLSVDGGLAQFRSGVSKLHKESGCPIVPFAIYGGYEAWPYNRCLPRLHKTAIHFGVPLSKQTSSLIETTRELKDMVGFMKASLDRRYNSEEERQISLLSLLQAKSDVFSARPALSIKTKTGWYELSYAELSRQAIKLSSYLIESGITHGDHIAILSESRPEFGVCFFGSMRAGATFVPLDIKLTSHELQSLLADCTPKIIFISSKSVKAFEEIKDSLDSNLKVFLIDHDIQLPNYQSIQNLASTNTHPSKERSLDETAVIIYTSGTTGNPKGVMNTIGNLLFEASQFERIVDPKEGDRFLSILPLNHLLELTQGFLGILHAGGTIYYTHSLNPKDIISLMNEKSITGMIAVPLFYRTLKNGIERDISKSNRLSQAWWHIATTTETIIKNQKFRRFIFTPLHNKLGGKLKLLVAGGAPLEISTAKFFDLIGIFILQGYGLTETSPVISCNKPSANRLGSVGQAIPGVEIKIDTKDSPEQGGEILTRGPHIMKGYFKRDDLTNEVIDKDNWFHTGDLGKIDKDGYLYITGRIKNLIVLGGGKKVHPEEVEDILSTTNHAKEICVLGIIAKTGSKEGTEEVCAVVVPSDSFKDQYTDQREMEKILTAELNNLSEKLASYKRPTKIIFMDDDLPKTATRKVKRNELLKIINSK
jgi:long-chain acyl-CoA synthetase